MVSRVIRPKPSDAHGAPIPASVPSVLQYAVIRDPIRPTDAEAKGDLLARYTTTQLDTRTTLEDVGLGHLFEAVVAEVPVEELLELRDDVVGADTVESLEEQLAVAQKEAAFSTLMKSRLADAASAVATKLEEVKVAYDALVEAQEKLAEEIDGG